MKTAALAALCLTASMTATAAGAAEKPLRVVLIDVEGGAATLFVTPEGRSLLVDTGWPAGLGGPPPVAGQPAPPGRSSADVIVAAAHKAGVQKIDYLMISHYHLDHIGGAVELMGKIPVGTVVDHGENRELPPADRPPSPNQTDKQYARYVAAIAGKPRRSVKAGETFKIGSLNLDFVSADRQVITRPLAGGGQTTLGCDAVGEKTNNIGGEENPRSVGFVATYGKARILNLADLTWDVEKQLVCATNQIGKIDLLVVSHHGSDLSNTPTLMAATAPTVALVGNGARKGGDKPVLERLKAAPSQPAVWQVHYATRAAEANTAEERIANMAEGAPDQNFSLEADVSTDGAITVINQRNAARQTYPKK